MVPGCFQKIIWYVLIIGKSNKENGILNWVDPKDKSGEFKRQVSSFRNWISNKPGAEFPPEKDRYHLCMSIWLYGELLLIANRCLLRVSMG